MRTLEAPMAKDGLIIAEKLRLQIDELDNCNKVYSYLVRSHADRMQSIIKDYDNSMLKSIDILEKQHSKIIKFCELELF